MISDKDFQKAAALLKRAAPHNEWENFVGALTAYTYVQIAACVEAPRDTVELQQGMARQCKKLLRMVEECEIEPKKGSTS